MAARFGYSYEGKSIKLEARLTLKRILGPKWEEVIGDCRMRSFLVCFEHTLLGRSRK